MRRIPRERGSRGALIRKLRIQSHQRPVLHFDHRSPTKRSRATQEKKPNEWKSNEPGIIIGAIDYGLTTLWSISPWGYVSFFAKTLERERETHSQPAIVTMLTTLPCTASEENSFKSQSLRKLFSGRVQCLIPFTLWCHRTLPWSRDESCSSILYS